MSAIMPRDGAAATRFLRFVGKPARWSSPRLAKAMEELAGFSVRQPDITLRELRADLLGTSFSWSEGKLGLSAERKLLLEELDELIAVHGEGTRAAELFL